MDPRLNIISTRLEKIKKVIAVSGGKGGIGKSSVASLLALNLSKMGYDVGLLDMDFCGPSTHIILGAKGQLPEEEKGIIPPEVKGIKFMSIVHYTEDKPAPLRGKEVSNALIELLAVTRWGELDFLIIDMPPGMGDTILDVIRLMKETEFVVVTTPSRMALETVKKVLKILKELNIPITGVVENMKMGDSSYVQEEMEKMGIRFLGKIPYDSEFENSLGNPEKLVKTSAAKSLKDIIHETKELQI